MSGGSQHNPNGRQSQLGAGWSPLQLQVANLLARAPQAHMASERGVTWHTPTPPPHMYHVPAPSPPDPLQGLLTLQAMKGANSVFRHTATPPELFRHTPTPPDKHLLRHTPSPGDVKAGGALPPAELYQHLGPGRDKLLRADELLSYARGGVDLTVGSRGSNGSPTAHHPAPAHNAAHPAAPALSVRDAPTINSLIARTRPAHARVDALLERLAPALPVAPPSAPPAHPNRAARPASPHSVIVHPRVAHTPSPPSSNEDSADSCGAPPGSKRKRKPERTIRVPAPPPPPAEILRPATPPRVSPIPAQILQNGDAGHRLQNEPEKPPTPQPPEPHARRKTRSGSAETIDDIAAMIASTDADRRDAAPEPSPPPAPEVPVTVDKLKSVLASPEPELKSPPPPAPSCPKPEQKSPQKSPKKEEPETPPIPAAAPRRRSARTSNTESANVPVESPSEAKPAELEASEVRSAEPTAASFVEVENQLEKMFAGLEEEEDPPGSEPTEKGSEKKQTAKARKRRKSAPTKGERKASKRASRASTGDEAPRRKGARKKAEKKEGKKEGSVKDAYDSGSNASSGRSRGPYIQIVGPRESPVSVSVVNEEERRGAGGGGGGAGGRRGSGGRRGAGGPRARGAGGPRAGGLRARGLHASTLGLRYDAATPDASWLCAFCDAGPHAGGLGDLFGPYPVDVASDEYSSLDEASKSRFSVCGGEGGESGAEAWFHESCGVWAPGVVAAGGRLWGLSEAVCGARGSRCATCGRAGAALACAARACPAAAHYPCAASWTLRDDFRAFCPRHA